MSLNTASMINTNTSGIGCPPGMKWPHRFNIDVNLTAIPTETIWIFSYGNDKYKNHSKKLYKYCICYVLTFLHCNMFWQARQVGRYQRDNFKSYIEEWQTMPWPNVCLFVCLMVFNTTFNNISVISWGSVLLVEETGGHDENHRPAASHW
jgi:hypothetical protein